MSKIECVLFRVISFTTLALLSIVNAYADNVVDHEPINRATVELWADETFTQAFDDRRFAGAAVAVVKDGDLLFSRGYGYSDYTNKIPMDPEDTLVRVCSTTKLFVATALMQLVESGAIASLTDPANLYLKRITLPDTESGPITLRDLTTHRGGFEDSYFNAATTKHLETPVDAKLVQRLIPEIVRPSGVLSVYSNANTALQGVIIEDITGIPLREHLKTNVLSPLGMVRSRLNDNPPAPNGTARSHVLYEDGKAVQLPLVAKHPVYAPSGGLFSTAEEMAMFVAAHLDAGITAQDPILKPKTFAKMHEPATRNHPALGAIGVQFFIDKLNGVKVVNHGCGLPGFTSYVAMLPEQNAGLFVSVVSASEPAANLKAMFGPLYQENPDKAVTSPNRATKFYWSFLERFVGFPVPEIVEEFETSPGQYVGRYKVERRTSTNMLAALELVVPQAFMMRVTEHDEAGLSINGSAAYRAIGDGVFQRGAHPARIFAFAEDAGGKPMRMYRSTAQAYTRVPIWQGAHVKQQVLLGSLLVLISGFAMGLGSAKFDQQSKFRVRLVSAVLVASLLFVWAVITLNYSFGKNIEHYVNQGGVLRLWVIVIVAHIMMAAALLSAFISMHGSKGISGGFAIVYKLHAFLLTVAAFAFVAVMASVNLIWFQLP